MSVCKVSLWAALRRALTHGEVRFLLWVCILRTSLGGTWCKSRSLLAWCNVVTGTPDACHIYRAPAGAA